MLLLTVGQQLCRLHAFVSLTLFSDNILQTVRETVVTAYQAAQSGAKLQSLLRVMLSLVSLILLSGHILQTVRKTAETASDSNQPISAEQTVLAYEHTNTHIHL